MRLAPASGAQFLDWPTHALYKFETPGRRSCRKQRGFVQLAKAVIRGMAAEGIAPAAHGRYRAPRIPAAESDQRASRGRVLESRTGRSTRGGTLRTCDAT